MANMNTARTHEDDGEASTWYDKIEHAARHTYDEGEPERDLDVVGTHGLRPRIAGKPEVNVSTGTEWSNMDGPFRWVVMRMAFDGVSGAVVLSAHRDDMTNAIRGELGVWLVTEGKQGMDKVEGPLREITLAYADSALNAIGSEIPQS